MARLVVGYWLRFISLGDPAQDEMADPRSTLLAPVDQLVLVVPHYAYPSTVSSEISIVSPIERIRSLFSKAQPRDERSDDEDGEGPEPSTEEKLEALKVKKAE